ncbi:MAG: RlmE family RNA methyltransferase [DPANN group archaeon]|nr:RlmE family RNA methyltransferase [DPANN group archaeon]
MDQWLVKRKGEFFYRKAKAEKYRARSAYKLLEVQSKFKLIKKGDIVVDLGAAPGSWSQVALEFIGENGFVIGVDIIPVVGLSGNYKFILGDICKESTLAKIKKELHRDASVVIADAAPDFSGIRTKDVGVSMQLSFRAIEIAKEILRNGGNFVTKTFRGIDYNLFIAEMKRNFGVVREVKPKASQQESAEVYVVGLKFKKPKSKP